MADLPSIRSTSVLLYHSLSGFSMERGQRGVRPPPRARSQPLTSPMAARSWSSRLPCIRNGLTSVPRIPQQSAWASLKLAVMGKTVMQRLLLPLQTEAVPGGQGTVGAEAGEVWVEVSAGRAGHCRGRGRGGLGRG